MKAMQKRMPSFPTSAPSLPYVLTFSFLVQLLLVLFVSLSRSLLQNALSRICALSSRLASAGLKGIRELNSEEEEEEGSGRRVGREREVAETMVALETGGYSLSKLLNEDKENTDVEQHLHRYPFFLLSLPSFPHLTHSLRPSPPFSLSLSRPLTTTQQELPDWHFDQTCPLLIPEKVRLLIVSLISTLFTPLSPGPLSALSFLLHEGGGVLRGMGGVGEGMGEGSDWLRHGVVVLFGCVSSLAELKSDKLHGTQTNWAGVKEMASQGEPRGFVCAAQDVLEEEGAEDALLVLGGVVVEREEQKVLLFTCGTSIEGLAWIGCDAQLVSEYS